VQRSSHDGWGIKSATEKVAGLSPQCVAN